MSRDRVVVNIGGPVTVAYRRFKGYYTCTALQFDLVGTGKTREAAFAQLRQLVEEYLISIVELLNEGEQVRFFNPSDADEWNCGDLRAFQINVELQDGPTAQALKKGFLQYDQRGLRRLAPYRDAIESVGLVPAHS